MPKAKAKKDDDIEINAKISGADKIKDLGKMMGKDKKSSSSDSAGGAFYFVGFIGAIFYYMQAASGFGEVLTGIIKALVWPAIIVYKLLESFYGLV